MAKILVEFDDIRQVDHLLHLVFRDVARAEGSLVIAERRLKAHTEGAQSLPGNMRRSAVQCVESAPEQIRVLWDTHAALRRARKNFR